MGRYLTERGFANTAPLLGEVTRYDKDGTPHTLVLVQGFIRNQGDGWGWTLDYLSRVLNSVAVIDPETQNEDIAEALAGYGNFAAAIGRRLGELHAILAAPTDNPAFARGKGDSRRRRRLGGSGCAPNWKRRWPRCAAIADWHDEESQQAATLVKERRPALNKTIDRLAMAAVESLKTRTHGDFHLGQVLVSSG